ncbi:Hypothetical predicted protein [Mytilus galloprovincialis]|uniref:Major facilitator superfamily (MFS) profile domain-containing protein n=1 Tax=Mytilus galloprovincialis TaxID=29158 RepID=A0A8B6CBZ7_MYTGA|nr:Hypothetical predicted protein [Mytilus galloprovincialis]
MVQISANVQRAVALVVGCLCMAIAGSVYCYGVYIVSVKKHYNYTQSAVELFGSTSNFGISLGFPAGMMCERFGGRWASLAGLLISSLGYMLLWSTTLMSHFYSTKSALQAVYFFVAGFGAIFLYMAAMTTNSINFNPKHRGKIVGILDASFSAGPAIMALLYGKIFAAGHVHDEENQNLGGFYLTTAISFAVIGIMGVSFLNSHPYGGERQIDEISLRVNESTIAGTFEVVNDTGPPIRNVTGLKLLLRFDYHFIAWSYIFCAGLQLMFQNNIQTYLKTFDLEEYTTLFGTVNPVCGVLSKFVVGFVSDMIVKKVPRVALLLIFNIVQTITLTLCIFFSDQFVMLVAALLVIGLANGAVWCLTPTMISEFYGLKYFGRNWGATIFGNAIGGFVVQQVYGWTYDNSIRIKGATDCKAGVHCFTWSFAMAAVLSLCACIFNIGLLQYQNDIKNRQSRTQNEPRTEL